MQIKRSIKFILHKRKQGETKSLAIRMRVTIKGQTPIDFPLKIKVDEDKWNKETEKAIGNTRETTEINRVIDEYKNQINEIFARYELLEKRTPTNQEVKDLFNDMAGLKSIIDDTGALNFWKVFDLFITQIGQKNQWTSATHQKFRTLKRHINNALPKISLQTLTENDLQQLIKYYQKKEFRNKTISRQLVFLRWFLRWTHQKGYYTGDLHEKFKPKLKGVSVDSKEIIYLSQEELRKLQEHQFQPIQKALERIRDVFLFQ